MPSQKLSKLDLYRVHRDQVEREGELIYHRAYWLLTTQTILFAAYTLALVSACSGITLKPSKLLVELIDPDAWDTARLSLIHSLLKFTAVLGLLLSFVNFVATLAAIEASANIRKHYDVAMLKHYDWNPDKPGFDVEYRSRASRRLGAQSGRIRGDDFLISPTPLRGYPFGNKKTSAR